jgi:hypothetical protein
MGRIKRLQAIDTQASRAELGLDALPICPLCERPIPSAQREAHHLVPKSKGGRETKWFHRICHRQIHALFSETELARYYHTAEALLAHADVQVFVQWVKRKPNHFNERTRQHGRRQSG